MTAVSTLFLLLSAVFALQTRAGDAAATTVAVSLTDKNGAKNRENATTTRLQIATATPLTSNMAAAEDGTSSESNYHDEDIELRPSSTRKPVALTVAEYMERAPEERRHLPRPIALATKNNSALSYYNYPFNQYALPECATQQVCNAVYTRLDRINALCACPDKFGDPCSVSFSSDDAHTIELVTDTSSGKALTLIKTCEPIATVRECRGSKDWSLLALQNVRTGKSHYLVVCRCVHEAVLEGPIAHENPPYAKIPGIRVFGMVCIRDIWRKRARDDEGRSRRRRSPHAARMLRILGRRNLPELPVDRVNHFVSGTHWN